MLLDAQSVAAVCLGNPDAGPWWYLYIMRDDHWLARTKRVVGRGSVITTRKRLHSICHGRPDKLSYPKEELFLSHRQRRVLPIRNEPRVPLVVCTSRLKIDETIDAACAFGGVSKLFLERMRSC
jgi:hypothetical protein